MSAGSRFQALGPATANDRAPKCVIVGLMTRSPRVADRSLANSNININCILTVTQHYWLKQMQNRDKVFHSRGMVVEHTDRKEPSGTWTARNLAVWSGTSWRILDSRAHLSSSLTSRFVLTNGAAGKRPDCTAASLYTQRRYKTPFNDDLAHKRETFKTTTLIIYVHNTTQQTKTVQSKKNRYFWTKINLDLFKVEHKIHLK